MNPPRRQRQSVAVRRVGVVVVVIAVAMTSGCGGTSTPTSSAGVGHATVGPTSIDALLLDTSLVVVATARAVSPDRSAPVSHPRSLVAMTVGEVVRGSAGSGIVVSRPRSEQGIPEGHVSLVVGHTYLLFLDENVDRHTYGVVGQNTGLFGFDVASKTVTRLGPTARWAPVSFPLSRVVNEIQALAAFGQGASVSAQATTTTTLAPAVSGACPPGCSLASDDDAITALASSATLVTLVTAHAGRSESSLVFTTDRVLQGNVVNDEKPEISGDGSANGSRAFVAGQSYLVFVSDNRGGSCLAATYSYDDTTQIATLISADDGHAVPEILLPGRVVALPRTITLASVEARMYPTGGPVYSSDAGESFCPGP
jgi:hypothetical protein